MLKTVRPIRRRRAKPDSADSPRPEREFPCRPTELRCYNGRLVAASQTVARPRETGLGQERFLGEKWWEGDSTMNRSHFDDVPEQIELDTLTELDRPIDAGDSVVWDTLPAGETLTFPGRKPRCATSERELLRVDPHLTLE